MRQLDFDLSIPAGHHLNDKYLATLGSSLIRTAVYQGLLNSLLFSYWHRARFRHYIIPSLGFAMSCVFGKQFKSYNFLLFLSSSLRDILSITLIYSPVSVLVRFFYFSCFFLLPPTPPPSKGGGSCRGIGYIFIKWIFRFFS